jgi:uncharacterized membrane protein YfcA
LIVLPFCGLPELAVPRLAVASAIAILIPITIAEAEGAVRRSGVDWEILTILAPSAAVGAVLVTTFVDLIDGRIAALALVAGTAIMAMRAFLVEERDAQEDEARAGPRLVSLSLITVAGSAGATLIGISGSLFCASPLARTLNPERAAATASALTLSFALAASGGYLLSPAPSGCGSACAGSIFLPALASIGMAAVLTAPLAMRLRPLLSLRAMRRMFALLVIVSAVVFGVPSPTLSSLWMETRDRALDLVLGPLCDPKPAPAAPVLRDDEDTRQLAARTTLAERRR